MNRLSILIAAFKAESWLAQCIASIKRQDLPDGWELEVLLGIDGCASTLDVARTLAGKGIRVLALAGNSGPYVTFNTLMQHARGDVIARFDADDVMQPGYVATHLQTLAEGADVTMAWSIVTDEKLETISVEATHEGHRIVDGENRHGCEGQVMFKREVWDMLGAFLPWRCGADTDFLNRARTHGFRISVIERFLYLKRTTAGSLTVNAATNFQSGLRKNYVALMKTYRSEYEQALRPLKVEPVQGAIEQILG